MPNQTNPELKELGTHAAGITDQHKTITTNETQRIDPPVSSPGVYDKRTQTK